MAEFKKPRRNTSFIVTIPKLAGRLLYAGYELKETINPFNSYHWRAWEVELDNTSAKIIKEFYDDIQRKCPSIVERWFSDQEQDEVDQNG